MFWYSLHNYFCSAPFTLVSSEQDITFLLLFKTPSHYYNRLYSLKTYADFDKRRDDKKKEARQV